jgi:competence protein ComEA
VSAHKKWVLVFWAIVVAMGVSILAWQERYFGQPKVEIVKEEQDSKLWVEVAGNVHKPGVFEVEAGTRVFQVLELAGGINREAADIGWVEANLNMAKEVKDGEKIYIPGKQSDLGAGGVSTGSGRVNINLASLSELEGLVGVGEATAQKIVSGRPYQKIDELWERKIVSQKVYEQIKEQISVW